MSTNEINQTSVLWRVQRAYKLIFIEYLISKVHRSFWFGSTFFSQLMVRSYILRPIFYCLVELFKDSFSVRRRSFWNYWELVSIILDVQTDPTFPNICRASLYFLYLLSCYTFSLPTFSLISLLLSLQSHTTFSYYFLTLFYLTTFSFYLPYSFTLFSLNFIWEEARIIDNSSNITMIEVVYLAFYLSKIYFWSQNLHLLVKQVLRFSDFSFRRLGFSILLRSYAF